MLAGVLVIAQLHDIVKEAPALVDAHLEDVDETLVGAGDGLKSADTRQFALERVLVGEGAPGDDLDRPVHARHAAGQPNLAVTAASDAPEQFVVRDRRKREVWLALAVLSVGWLGLLAFRPHADHN